MGQVNGAFRKKRVNFSMVSNIALRDKKLSLKAKGLYGLIQSYITIEDENFILTKTMLFNMCQEGERAFEGAWTELKENGYLKIYRQPDITKKGAFVYEYELLDSPNINTPVLTSYDKDGILKSTIEIKKAANIGQKEINNEVHNANSEKSKENVDTNIECVEKVLRIKLTDKQKEVIRTLDKEKLITSVRLTSSYENKRPDEYYRLLVKIYNNPNNHNFQQVNNSSVKCGFNNFESRTYDYDSLEKKLLGWDTD